MIFFGERATARLLIMPASFFANSFRNPLGDGLTSPENDGDGFYVAFGFDEPNPDIGGSHHLGADWNGEGGGNTDLGDPVYAVGNGTVVAIVSDQGSATTGFGNYLVLRHDLPEPTLVNGQWVTQVHSLYAHLNTASSFSVGQQVGIGTQIGMLGMSGYADVAHLHLEVTIGSVLPTSDDGYNPSGAPAGWIDPVEFVQTMRSTAPSGPNDFEIQRIGMLGALEAYKSGMQGNSLLGSLPEGFGSWINVLNQAELSAFLGPRFDSSRHRFTEDGLFIGRPDTVSLSDPETSQGILGTTIIDGEQTLVLSFRGTDSHDASWFGSYLAAFFDGQTFAQSGTVAHYETFAPLIDAALNYATANGISRVIVSGHSLGGTLADVFAISDSQRFLDAGLNLNVVSIASAGFDPDIASLLDVVNQDVVTVSQGEVTSIAVPEWYLGVANSLDRVTFAERDEYSLAQELLNNLSPNFVLEYNIGFELFSGTLEIELPNHRNIDVDYGGGERGFGLQHNYYLYFNNLTALSESHLSDDFQAGMRIIMGHGRGFAGAGWTEYTANDNGTNFAVLRGGATNDFILGLEGDDLIRGQSGSDLLDGGSGVDVLEGGAGTDVLAGGSGVDQLIGGSEADVFFFADGDFPLFQSVNPDRIADYNRGTGTYSAAEGDLIDLSGINFATSNGSGSTSTVRLRSIEASGGLPAGAILEINIGDDIWRGIARLDGVATGDAVTIALTDAQSVARTGSTFVVDGVGNGTTWSISPATRNVAEGNITISFTITRSGTNLGAETVYISTTMVHGSFNSGDYDRLLNEEYSFAEGQNNLTVTVTINDDSIDEGDETFGLIVQSDSSDPDSVFLTSATFTIQDDDDPDVPATGSNFIGENGDDIWIGTNGTDVAYGYGGDDDLTGSGAADAIYSGDDDDSISGGSGNDYLDAGSGRDTVYGGDGDDTVLAGQDGADRLYGGAGFDYLYLDRSRSTQSFLITMGGGGSQTLIDGSILSSFEWVSLTLGSGNDRVTFSEVVLQGQQVDAGSGTDRAILDYSSLSVAITTVNYGGGSIGIGQYLGSSGFNYGVYTYGVEEFDITGGAGNDSFSANGMAWVSFKGGAGNDNLSVGAVVAGTLSGGIGFDYLELDRSASTADETAWVDGLTGGAFVLSSGTAVSGIEQVYLVTGSGNDRATFTNVDQARGSSWTGGAGTDRAILDYSSLSAAITTVNYSGGSIGIGQYLGSSGFNYGVYTYRVEEFDITGGAGNDSFSANGMAWVSFKGGAGNDNLSVGTVAAGVLSGGSGFDYLELDRSASTADETVRVDGQTGGSFMLTGGTTVSGVEQVYLVTGSGNDRATFTNVDQTRGSSWTAGSGTDRAILDYSALSVAITTVNYGGGQISVGQYLGSSGFNYGVYTIGVEEFDITGGAGNDSFDASTSTWARLIGGTGNDYLSGETGNDILIGGIGNDVLYGETGSDTLDAGDGDDTIDAGAGGADNIYGGAGFDRLTLDISNVTQDIVIDSQMADTLTLPDGTVLSGIEALVSLTTGAGNDTVTFSSPIVEGHSFDAGSGTDRAILDYSSLSVAITTVNYGGGSIGIGQYLGSSGFNYGAYTIGVEEFDITGGAGNDSFDASTSTWARLIGGEGNDNLTGGVGNDSLSGGSGDDALYGGTGNDTLNAGDGDDTIDAGDGVDLIVMSGNRAEWVFTGNAAVLGAQGTGFDTGLKSISNAEFLQFDDGTVEADDLLSVPNQPPVINSNGGGASAAVSVAENTTAVTTVTSTDPDAGATRTFSIRGGADAAVFTINATTGDLAFVSSRNFEAPTDAVGNNVYDVVVQVSDRTLTDSQALAVMVTNTAQGVTIIGTAGNDVISPNLTAVDQPFATDEADVISGLSGNDWITPSAGADTVNGGDGVDMVSFFDAMARAVVDLAAGTAMIGAETDVLSNIENVTGTIFGDLITGNAAANRLRGLGDYDWMVGSGGGDTFEGGTGRDMVAYSSATSGVTASLQTDTGTAGQATGDRYVDVENLTGSSFADRLIGDNDRNILRGLASDDFIFGLGGNDTLDGGAGADRLDGGLGNDRITGGRGNDTIEGGTGWDTALFTGARADYTVTTLVDGRTTVLHTAGGIDGIDFLTGIEVLQFSDGRLFL